MFCNNITYKFYFPIKNIHPLALQNYSLFYNDYATYMFNKVIT